MKTIDSMLNEFIGGARTAVDVTIIWCTYAPFLLYVLSSKFGWTSEFSMKDWNIIPVVFLISICLENVFKYYKEKNKEKKDRNDTKAILYMVICLCSIIFVSMDMEDLKNFSYFKCMVLYMINLFGRFDFTKKKYLLWCLCDAYILINFAFSFFDECNKIIMCKHLLNIIVAGLLWFQDYLVESETHSLKEQKDLAKTKIYYVLLLIPIAIICNFRLYKISTLVEMFGVKIGGTAINAN